MIALIVSLTLGCTGPNEVVVTCVTDSPTDDVMFSMSCDEWADHGWQTMQGPEDACGADGSGCTCTVDTGRCMFPNGVND